MSETFKEFCAEVYTATYAAETERLSAEAAASSNKLVGYGKATEIETAAQKEAIRRATVEGIRRYPDMEAAEIWRAIYETHVHRKSGIDNADTIAKVVSADQSWKKSSGHAFEEIVKLLGSEALRDIGIDIVLQRDLHSLINNDQLQNEPRDISWLKEQIMSGIFDLYALVRKDGKQYCFGCIQSKTSIRDRVTRDREPSMHAMQSFFWSTIIVLDGGYLKNPKFVNMVNGGTQEHPYNGWHGMYVFSDRYTQGRIYPLDANFTVFKRHASQAANFWLTQRQWLNINWKATD